MAFSLFPSLTPMHSDLSPGSLFQGRLARVSDTQLGLLPSDKGSRVMINSVLYTLPVEGLLCNTNFGVIDATGTSTGAGVVASTVYHAYVADAREPVLPGQLRLSTVAPTAGTDGVRRLATSGPGSAWMYVGSLFINAGSLLLDVNNTRHIASWFNPQLTRCHTPIGWTGAGGPVTIDTNAQSNWGPAFGTSAVGQIGTLSFMDLGRDDMHLSMQGNVSSTAAAEWTVALSTSPGVPGTLAPILSHQDGPVTGGVGRGFTLSGWQRANGSPDLRNVVLLSRSAASTLLRMLAELPNNGLAGAGPVGLFLSASFMG